MVGKKKLKEYKKGLTTQLPFLEVSPRTLLRRATLERPQKSLWKSPKPEAFVWS